MSKSYDEINERIRRGEAVVLTAEEMTALVREEGAKKAAKKVDVVTTGTFGPMCSSGVFINLGQSDPPIRMSAVWLNDVRVCSDLAAVDVYVGATALSEKEGMNYGGGHVIEELIEGKWIKLRSVALTTDCYPRAQIETWINRDTVNQMLMFNPRNAYQNYATATNGSDRTIYTYMGILTPNFGNLTYSGAGELSPLLNDPWYRTIGGGTRIFLGGARGYVASQGTQHNPSVERTAGGIPKRPAGTLALMGDAKMMDSRYIRGARFCRYGVSLYVGVGIPIPILDEEMAAFAGVSAEQIETPVLDYSQPVRDREPLRMVNFKELRSGMVELNGKKVRTAPISSYKMAREIAGKLKDWIVSGDFYLSEPLEPLPKEGALNTLEERKIKGKNSPKSGGAHKRSKGGKPH